MSHHYGHIAYRTINILNYIHNMCRFRFAAEISFKLCLSFVEIQLKLSLNKRILKSNKTITWNCWSEGRKLRNFMFPPNWNSIELKCIKSPKQKLYEFRWSHHAQTFMFIWILKLWCRMQSYQLMECNIVWMKNFPIRWIPIQFTLQLWNS